MAACTWSRLKGCGGKTVNPNQVLVFELLCQVGASLPRLHLCCGRWCWRTRGAACTLRQRNDNVGMETIVLFVLFVLVLWLERRCACALGGWHLFCVSCVSYVLNTRDTFRKNHTVHLPQEFFLHTHTHAHTHLTNSKVKRVVNGFGRALQ